MIFVQDIFIILFVLLAVPVAIFAVQVLVSLLPYFDKALPIAARPSIAVLIPAHNEQQGIGATLDSLRAQLVPGDRIIVIADNCEDNTAAVSYKHLTLPTKRIV